MNEWNVTFSYLTGMPDKVMAADNYDLLRQVQALAKTQMRPLEEESFTDQVNFYFRRPSGRRELFMIVMA